MCTVISCVWYADLTGGGEWFELYSQPPVSQGREKIGHPDDSLCPWSAVLGRSEIRDQTGHCRCRKFVLEEACNEALDKQGLAGRWGFSVRLAYRPLGLFRCHQADVVGYRWTLAGQGVGLAAPLMSPFHKHLACDLCRSSDKAPCGKMDVGTRQFKPESHKKRKKERVASPSTQINSNQFGVI